MNFFDITNSVFLEDEPREMAKPNPLPLIRSISAMHSKKTLYVGDSVEDMIMANKAADKGYDVSFCGIVGTSKNPQKKRHLFQSKGIFLVLESIQDIPKALNLEYR